MNAHTAYWKNELFAQMKIFKAVGFIQGQINASISHGKHKPQLIKTGTVSASVLSPFITQGPASLKRLDYQASAHKTRPTPVPPLLVFSSSLSTGNDG